MQYKIFEEPNDLGVYAINESTGKKYVFKPTDIIPDLTDDQMLLYDDLGEMYVAESADGSPIDEDEINDIWDAVNEYWRNKTGDGSDVN